MYGVSIIAGHGTNNSGMLLQVALKYKSSTSTQTLIPILPVVLSLIGCLDIKGCKTKGSHCMRCFVI